MAEGDFLKIGVFKAISKKTLARGVLLSAMLALIVFISFGESIGAPTWEEIGVSVNVFDGANFSKEDDLTVGFLNIGKSDSIVITCGGYNILIDAGDLSKNGRTVSYLKRCSIDQLDLIINTHPDIDHINEMPQVLENFEVKRFWTCALPEGLVPDGNAYKAMSKILKDENIETSYVHSGDRIVLGDLCLDVLAPTKNDYKEINDYSVVVMMTYKGTKWLFAGDAQKDAEEDILGLYNDLDCDVLKVGHHGSNSSSSMEFLKAVKPEKAVITVSDDSKSLPSQKVLNRLKDINCELYRTDLDGDIVMTSDGQTINVYTIG